MKKSLLIIAVLLLLATNALPAQQMSLADVVASAAREVEEALPRGTMVAVMRGDAVCLTSIVCYS